MSASYYIVTLTKYPEFIYHYFDENNIYVVKLMGSVTSMNALPIFAIAKIHIFWCGVIQTTIESKTKLFRSNMEYSVAKCRFSLHMFL